MDGSSAVFVVIDEDNAYLMSKKSKILLSRRYPGLYIEYFDNRRSSKEIPELEDGATLGHDVIGDAEGQSLLHCLFIALRHAEDFYEQACGYSMELPHRKSCKVRVIFYGKKLKIN